MVPAEGQLDLGYGEGDPEYVEYTLDIENNVQSARGIGESIELSKTGNGRMTYSFLVSPVSYLKVSRRSCPLS
jgi:hypothetical protein